MPPPTSTNEKYFMLDKEGGLIPKSGGVSIPWIELTSKLLLNSSIAVYGVSGSGKTVIFRYIIDLLKNLVSSYTVYSPSNNTNKNYTGTIPPRCIYTNPSEEEIKSHWTTQEQRATLYIVINEPIIYEIESTHPLTSTTDVCTLPCIDWIIRYLNSEAREDASLLVQQWEDNLALKIQEITTKYAGNIEQMRGPINKAKKETHVGCRKDKKKLIAERKEQLAKYKDSKDLDPSFKNQPLGNLWNFAKYIRMNPNKLIIKDDVSGLLKTWEKITVSNEKGAPVPIQLEEGFRGRHLFMTIITAIHVYSALGKKIRGNSHVIIFTSADSAYDFIKHNDTIPAVQKKILSAQIDTIFADFELYKLKDPNAVQHYKAVMTNGSISYTKVPKCQNERVETVQWALSEEVEKQFPSASAISQLKF